MSNGEENEVRAMLEAAIKGRKSVHLDYAGDPRQVSPHALGLRAGVLHVLVYQYVGRSRTGRIVPGSNENWRCMALDQITGLQIVDDDWQTSTSNSRPETCLDTILLQAAQ